MSFEDGRSCLRQRIQRRAGLLKLMTHNLNVLPGVQICWKAPEGGSRTTAPRALARVLLWLFSVITVDGEPLFGEVIGNHLEPDECGLEIVTELMQATLCLLSPRMSLNPYCAKCFNIPVVLGCEQLLSGS